MAKVLLVVGVTTKQDIAKCHEHDGHGAEATARARTEGWLQEATDLPE
jgi:hypothetical protein